jgi:hypothetical protein
MNHRPLEIIAGIVTLLSVISVPVRSSVQTPPRPPSVIPPVNLDQLDRVRQDALSQQLEVAKLTRDTRALAELFARTRPQTLPPPRVVHNASDAGTVRTAPDVRGSETENEEHGCSQ